MLLLAALTISSFFSSCAVDTQVESQPPTLTELFTMPQMLEFLLVGVPLVGLAIGLATLFSFSMTKRSADARTRILPAACYALGFQLFLLGVISIPYIVILYLEKDVVPIWVFWCSVALVVLWPAAVLARFVLTGVPSNRWRISLAALRSPLVIVGCVVVSALMIGGSCVLSFPFHLDDLRTNQDKFPRPVMASQILRVAVQGEVLTMTLLAKNQSRGAIIITSQRVGMGSVIGQIINAQVPLIISRDQMMAIDLAFSPVIDGFDENATHLLQFDTRCPGSDWEDSPATEGETPIVTRASRAPAAPVRPFSWFR
jgi:hypothetical protein